MTHFPSRMNEKDLEKTWISDNLTGLIQQPLLDIVTMTSHGERLSDDSCQESVCHNGQMPSLRQEPDNA